VSWSHELKLTRSLNNQCNVPGNACSTSWLRLPRWLLFRLWRQSEKHVH
jgi:hypothetical protein